MFKLSKFMFGKIDQLPYALAFLLLLQLFPALYNALDHSPGLLCPWDSLGKNTGGGGHARLQGIFPTQGLYLNLLWPLHYGPILYH